MRTELSFPSQFTPRVFEHSLDWRFLLPLVDPTRTCVGSAGETGLAEALAQIGIPVPNQLSTFESRAGRDGSLHAFVLPLGLPLRWSSDRTRDQVQVYRSIRESLSPGGSFLLGFENSWSFRSNVHYRRSTPARAARQLRQAGFRRVQTFGAMPGLRIPEYILPLSGPQVDFSLAHRFRRKPVLLSMLSMLTRVIGPQRISVFFPCYFVLAAV